MSKRSEAVIRWRQNTKRKLIIAFGGKCAICGYDKCDDVMDFHHVDPTQKEDYWGNMRSNIKSLSAILDELKKCVMLCRNCHGELHSTRSSTTLPPNAFRLTDDICQSILNDTHEDIPKDECVVCGTLKPKWRDTCSVRCASLRSRTNTIDWDSKPDILEMLEMYPHSEIADIIGASTGAVRVRLNTVDPTGELRKIAMKKRKSFAKARIVNVLDSKQS